MTETTPLWIKEFGADYDVPAAIANHPMLADISWHNDMMPSFALATEERITRRLCVDHVDPAQREEPTWSRFAVSVDGVDDALYVGDDLDTALRVMLEPLTERAANGAHKVSR